MPLERKRKRKKVSTSFDVKSNERMVELGSVKISDCPWNAEPLPRNVTPCGNDPMKRDYFRGSIGEIFELCVEGHAVFACSRSRLASCHHYGNLRVSQRFVISWGTVISRLPETLLNDAYLKNPSVHYHDHTDNEEWTVEARPDLR